MDIDEELHRRNHFPCSCTGATGAAPFHAAAEPGLVAAASVQLRCDLATAEDIAPTTEGSHPVTNFQATYDFQT